VLVFDFEGNILRQTKTDFDYSVTSNKPSLESVLKKSALSCFQSDRQAGMVLSGGVDSSLIYALWYEQTGNALPTFTAHFGEKYNSDFSDLKYAELLCKKYPSQHEGIQITRETLMANWQEYVLSMDQPVGDGAGFLTWYIARQIKSQVKILVSGAGADELFGGYNRHKAFLQYLKNPSFSSLAGKVMASLGMKEAKKFSSSIEENAEETFIQMAALQRIPKEHLPEFVKYYPRDGGDLKNALAFDRQFYLVNDILKIHDNSCMAHGIEGRAPYLDRDLIAYAVQLCEQDLRKNIGKRKLKSLLNARGLEVISNRKKLGFGMPVREWMDDCDFREFVFRPIREMERTWRDQFPAEIRTLMRKPESLIEANFLLIWNWFVLASWLQKYPT
jgi:asparagine synthase (glutamine-hydrolysing)